MLWERPRVAEQRAPQVAPLAPTRFACAPRLRSHGACEVVVVSTSPAAVFYRWPVAVAVAGSRRHTPVRWPVPSLPEGESLPVELRRESGHSPLGEAVDAVQRLAHSDGRHATEDA